MNIFYNLINWKVLYTVPPNTYRLQMIWNHLQVSYSKKPLECLRNIVKYDNCENKIFTCEEFKTVICY